MKKIMGGNSVQLKLAEYNAEGKFERFLELNKKDSYSGFLLGRDYIETHYNNSWYSATKDEKDPLNRFNGLFDGITYGNGRFVLISDLNRLEIEEKMKMIWATPLAEKYAEDNEMNCEQSLIICFMEDAPSIENPELWEKVK